MSEERAFCPTCNRDYPLNDVCQHFKKYGYKPGTSIPFIQKLIKENYEPGSWFHRKKFKKHIGTSVGNTRTKDTQCKACGKNLNHFNQEKIAAHIAKHAEEEEKSKAQQRLF